MEKHCYIILLELHSGGEIYESLYNEIKSFDGWGRLTFSSWAIISNKSSSQIRDDLSAYLYEGDRIMVVLSGKSAAWKNTCASNEWVRKNIIK